MPFDGGEQGHFGDVAILLDARSRLADRDH